MGPALEPARPNDIAHAPSALHCEADAKTPLDRTRLGSSVWPVEFAPLCLRIPILIRVTTKKCPCHGLYLAGKNLTFVSSRQDTRSYCGLGGISLITRPCGA